MKYSKELKIGVFVVVVLVASFFLINYLRGEDIMNKEIELVSRYDRVEGLVASAPVFIKGYKAGKVSEVVYEPENDEFKVVCSVRKEFKIPQDSRMTIYAVDIMGGKGVRIDLGTSEELVSDGDYLQPAFEAGLMDGLAADLGPLLKKVGTTLDSLEVTVAGVNRVLSQKNTQSISNTLAHLEKTMSDVKKIAASVEGRSAELEAFIANLSELSESFNGIASKVDTTVTGVNELMGTINSSDIDGVVTSLNELLENINDPDGTVGKLLNDGSVYNSVDSLLNDVDALVKKIQENPKKYIKISIF
jgi:phospholipid/cholesterol/gamma-HCH transport system substrate-binding protein